MSFQCGFSLEDELGGLVSAVDQIEQIAEDAGIELEGDDDLDEEQDDDAEDDDDGLGTGRCSA